MGGGEGSGRVSGSLASNFSVSLFHGITYLHSTCHTSRFITRLQPHSLTAREMFTIETPYLYLKMVLVVKTTYNVKHCAEWLSQSVNRLPSVL